MKINYKKILVIGSNSFSGANFINSSLTNNKRIIGISRSKENTSLMLPYKKNKNIKNFQFYKLDVNRKLDDILNIINSFKPEIIINFSAQGEVRTSWTFPEQWFQTNSLSVVSLSNRLLKYRFLKRYVSISTPEVYGNIKNKIIENKNYDPSTPYAVSKLAGDLHLLTLYKKYNFPVVFTRSANVYGSCQQLYRIIPKSIIYLKKNKKIQLHGKGKTIRSFVHIQDVTDAILKIINNGNNGEVYHIAPKSGELSIFNLVKLICNIMNKNFTSSINLIPENYGQDASYILESNKIRKELNWNEKITLENGIIETIQWIDSNWKIISKMTTKYSHKI